MNTHAIASRLRWTLWLFAAGACVAAAAQFTAAAPPWQFASFKKIDADPNKNYPVTDANGPWMIVVATFHGDQSEPRARQLVYELRKQYKLNAYTLAKVYDYSQKGMQGEGLYPDGTPIKVHYLNGQRLQEVAVLVGDYHRVDDPEGQKVLAMLKHAQPDSLKPPTDPPADQGALAGLKKLPQQMFAAKGFGPLATAYITTNPLLPREYFVNRGLDKIVASMNDGVEHSLLNCKGRYSVEIATFTGRVTIDQQEIRRLEHEQNKGLSPQDDEKSGLAAGAEKAHALTEFLRGKGVEAYEFHDRRSSIVTVGSFESIGTPRPDGKIEMNPQVHAIMVKYGAIESKLDPAGGAAPATGLGSKVVNFTQWGKKWTIPYDMQPMPIEIPRRSISSDYQQAAVVR